MASINASRPPRGGRGLKHISLFQVRTMLRRPPRGGRGLKQLGQWANYINFSGRPRAGGVD